MDKIKEVIIKASTFWVLIGTFLVSLGAAGVDLPSWMPELFSQAFIDNLLIAVGAAIDFVSFLRGIFAVTKDDGGAEVQALSAKQAREFYINPLKIAA